MQLLVKINREISINIEIKNVHQKLLNNKLFVKVSVAQLSRLWGGAKFDYEGFGGGGSKVRILNKKTAFFNR